MTGTHALTAWADDVLRSLTTNVPVTRETISCVTGTFCGRGLRLEVSANAVRRVPVTLPRGNNYPFAKQRDRHARITWGIGHVVCSLTTNVPVTRETISCVTGTFCGRGLRLEIPTNAVRRVPVTLPQDHTYPFASKAIRYG